MNRVWSPPTMLSDCEIRVFGKKKKKEKEKPKSNTCRVTYLSVGVKGRRSIRPGLTLKALGSQERFWHPHQTSAFSISETSGIAPCIAGNYYKSSTTCSRGVEGDALAA